jgi:hypothetical protein
MALIKCSECGKEISDKAVACPNCGCPVTPVSDNITTETPPQTNEKPKNNNAAKGCSCGCLVIIAIVLLIGFIGSTSGTSNNKVSNGLQSMNLTPEQEATMLQVFQDSGIGEISSVKLFQSGEAETSYYLSDDEVNNIVVWINNADKTVKAIYYNDNDIYLNGAVVSQITNYYVNSTDRDKYRTVSQEAIKKILNYPDTAKFPGLPKWKFGIDNGVVIVQSTVTAKNAFGVESTMDFQLKFNNQNITSLILDGTEYINN